MQLLISGNSVGLLFIQQDGKYACTWKMLVVPISEGYILRASLGGNNYEWAYLLYWCCHNSCLRFTRLNQDFREMVKLCLYMCTLYIRSFTTVAEQMSLSWIQICDLGDKLNSLQIPDSTKCITSFCLIISRVVNCLRFDRLSIDYYHVWSITAILSINRQIMWSLFCAFIW